MSLRRSPGTWPELPVTCTDSVSPTDTPQILRTRRRSCIRCSTKVRLASYTWWVFTEHRVVSHQPGAMGQMTLPPCCPSESTWRGEDGCTAIVGHTDIDRNGEVWCRGEHDDPCVRPAAVATRKGYNRRFSSGRPRLEYGGSVNFAMGRAYTSERRHTTDCSPTPPDSQLETTWKRRGYSAVYCSRPSYQAHGRTGRSSRYHSDRITSWYTTEGTTGLL